MNKLNMNDVLEYVEENIGAFHQARIDNINKLKLSNLLERKNPYLFKAKNILTAEMFVRKLVDAHLSSNEETIFGNWLEGLVIFISEKVSGGDKSGITGIDLDFKRDGKRYLVAIKSGPNWGNSSQIEKMRNHFTSAAKTLRTSGSNITVVAINGCCYGTENNPDRGDYFKYCGQDFWEFISGESNLYIDIIIPLGHQAKQKNDEFEQSYSKIINRFTMEFSSSYCKPNGEIDWEAWIKFNSGSKKKNFDKDM
ncbi:MAG: cytosolic protein [Alphaproteobacteria bacterium]|nr:cytosolic protein [Alphaproteobacteria bacterium]